MAWELAQAWLDVLDAQPPTSSRSAEARAAEFGFRLLGILGWGLQLQHCVRCQKFCPPERSSYLVLAAGGIVCRACGGTGLVLEPGLRERLLATESDQFLDEETGAKALRLVEAAFLLHAGIDT
jgi:DNA repair protein RecO (recombination protein O)